MKNAIDRIAESIKEELTQSLDRCGLMNRLFNRVKTDSSIRHKLHINGAK